MGISSFRFRVSFLGFLFLVVVGYAEAPDPLLAPSQSVASVLGGSETDARHFLETLRKHWTLGSANNRVAISRIAIELLRAHAGLDQKIAKEYPGWLSETNTTQNAFFRWLGASAQASVRTVIDTKTVPNFSEISNWLVPLRRARRGSERTLPLWERLAETLVDFDGKDLKWATPSVENLPRLRTTARKAYSSFSDRKVLTDWIAREESIIETLTGLSQWNGLERQALLNKARFLFLGQSTGNYFWNVSQYSDAARKARHLARVTLPGSIEVSPPLDIATNDLDSLMKVGQVAGPAASAYVIEDDGFPVFDQGNSARCLQFASTSIVEHLIHRRSGNKVDISEWYAVDHACATTDTFNEFTDQPFLFKKTGLAAQYGIADFTRRVLFTHSEGGPWATGGITTADLDLIKAAIRTYDAPVLFVYKPAEVEWWHADSCIGYDDARQVLLCRDSAFGSPSFKDGKWYRDIYEMPYKLAIRSGRHASVYYLPDEDPYLPAKRPLEVPSKALPPLS